MPSLRLEMAPKHEADEGRRDEHRDDERHPRVPGRRPTPPSASDEVAMVKPAMP